MSNSNVIPSLNLDGKPYSGLMDEAMYDELLREWASRRKYNVSRALREFESAQYEKAVVSIDPAFKRLLDHGPNLMMIYRVNRDHHPSDAEVSGGLEEGQAEGIPRMSEHFERPINNKLPDARISKNVEERRRCVRQDTLGRHPARADHLHDRYIDCRSNSLGQLEAHLDRARAAEYLMGLTADMAQERGKRPDDADEV